MSLGFFAFLSAFPPEPQHPSVAYGDSSPLEKRAAFAGTNCGAKKSKMCRFSVSRAPSVTLTRDTFLPERLIVPHCAAAEEKSADFEF